MAGLPEYLTPSRCRDLEHQAICTFRAGAQFEGKPRPSDLPPGICPGAVKRDPGSDRWYITMGHAGFNNPANNGRGYTTCARAIAAYKRCLPGAR